MQNENDKKINISFQNSAQASRQQVKIVTSIPDPHPPTFQYNPLCSILRVLFVKLLSSIFPDLIYSPATLLSIDRSAFGSSSLPGLVSSFWRRARLETSIITAPVFPQTITPGLGSDRRRRERKERGEEKGKKFKVKGRKLRKQASIDPDATAPSQPNRLER